LVGQIEVRLKELIREICEELQSELIELEIMPDHVHQGSDCRRIEYNLSFC